MFNQNSFIVKLWVKYVNTPDSGYTVEHIPGISNLREEVLKQVV